MKILEVKKAWFPKTRKEIHPKNKKGTISKNEKRKVNPKEGGYNFQMKKEACQWKSRKVPIQLMRVHGLRKLGNMKSKFHLEVMLSIK